MKVAVVGAGAAGLISVKHCLDFDCEVVAFEQSDKVGGTWVYTDNTGKDKNGLDLHTSLYKSLYTNLPIELMCYPNEPFSERKESFVSSDVILRYFETFADKYSLRDYIKFEHQVIRVRPSSDGSWELIARNLLSDTHETFLFDAVLICNGHFNSCFVPKYDGQELFAGKQMHSHDYRCPTLFDDESILVIGGNFSAVDIVQQSVKHAKSITWSHHLKHMPDIKAFGDNVDQKPDILKFISNGAEFRDGTVSQFDRVVYCTGYKYNFPFLSVDCGISTCDDYVKPLFKHCLNINRPTMGFIGLPNLICPNQMFSLQARFCLTFMTKRKQLPTRDDMLSEHDSEMEARWKQAQPKKKAHVMGPLQQQYYADLAATADIEPIKPVIASMHRYTNINREKDFINFRRKKFYIIDDETFETKPI